MGKSGTLAAPLETAELAIARREAAAAMARLAELAVEYADDRVAQERIAAQDRITQDRITQDRITQDRGGGPGSNRPRPGEFVADELSLVLREQPYAMRCLLARSRRLTASLPTVWEAFRRGDVDADQVRVIDRVARRVAETATLAAIDDQVVDAAQSRCPKQLATWLLRLVVQLEPHAFAARHRRALAERRVTVVQGSDGMGYVTGEVSAEDGAAIDATLAAAARGFGAGDPRTEQQRRSDVFADLLLGRLRLVDPDDDERDGPIERPRSEHGARQIGEYELGAAEPGWADPGQHDPNLGQPESGQPNGEAEAADGRHSGWLEIEEIDLETGELIGVTRQPLDAAGEVLDLPEQRPPVARLSPVVAKARRQLRIGVIVPLSSLLGMTEAPAELADRSAFVPAEVLRKTIADALGSGEGDEVLFTRLLTDDGGRLLDTTELGRYPSRRLAEAVRLRAATCRFPTCSVPADRCDVDHHNPVPRGPTAGTNLDPACRRHHRGKTFAWLASVRDDHGVDWTMPDAERYRCVDEPLPVGRSRPVTRLDQSLRL